MNWCDKIRRNQKGMTLLELIIYIAILSLIMVVIGETLLTTIFTSKKIAARREVDQNMDFSIKKIQQSIEQASVVTGTYPSNTLNLTINGQTTTYSLSSGILQKTEGGTISDLTSNKVAIAPGGSYLFYEIVNTPAQPTVQISMKISYISNDPQTQNIITYTQTTFALRP